VFGLFFKAGDPVILLDLGHTEAESLFRKDADGGDGDVGVLVAVPGDHILVIHFVDMVAGEDDHMFGSLGEDTVQVLVDGVGGTLIPLVAHAFHGRQDFDELAHLGREEVPAIADMAV